MQSFDVLAVRAARSVRSNDVLGDRELIERSEEVRVVLLRDVHEPFGERHTVGRIEQRQGHAIEAGLLAMIELDEDRVGLCRIDPIRASTTRLALGGHDTWMTFEKVVSGQR